VKNLYILKTGTTFSSILDHYGDFDQWTISSLGPVSVKIRVVNAAEGSELPPAEDCLGVVITGSHDMVTDGLPWSIAAEKWLPSLIREEVPLLGICYGHQLLARALGGEVGYHPGGIESGTVEISLSSSCSDDPLFSGLPVEFSVHADHSQTVLSLPPGAVCLASSPHDPHHAFRIGKNAWGLQFHPEFSVEIMSMYISEQADKLRETGLNVPSLLAGVRDTPVPRILMKKFLLLASRNI
jgi:GMP synthase (glutamine-hydrolysing)